MEDRRLLSIAAWSDENMAPVEDASNHQALAADVNSALESPASKAGAPEFVPGEILVGFENEVPAAYRAKGAAAALGAAGKIVAADGLHNPRVLMHVPPNADQGARLATHWKLPAGADVQDMVNRLSDRPGIAYAEPNYIQWADATLPNDPQFDDLWGLDNTGQTGGTADADIDAPEAWDITTGSGSIVVGVIDTGVDYTHEDLAANMWTNPGETPGNDVDDDGNGYVDDVYGWDFYNDDSDPMDDNGHGSHCSGTIGGVGNNGIGVAGVNWNVQIMAIKFLSSGGGGSRADAIDSVNYATMMGAQLTSNSWGGGGYSEALENAIAASGDANMLFVAAAGNSNSDNDASPYYPATYPLENIISVAATDHDDAKASFSSYGATTVDLAAPGVNILSTVPGGYDGTYSGTSMATPHVAGVAALAWDVLGSSAPYADIKGAVLSGTDPVASMAGITLTGGRLNARGTLEQVGMAVVGSTPAAGGIIAYQPTVFVIDFSFPVDVDIEPLDKTDLSVNGIFADSVVPSGGGYTATFTYYTSPVIVDEVPQEGEYTMRMDADSVSTSSPVAHPSLWAWEGTFHYTEMYVESTVPADGATVALPLTTLSVTFSKQYQTDTVHVGDLIVNQGQVTEVTPMGDGRTLEYTLEGVVNEGTLIAEIPGGALTDSAGNPMAPFSASFELDFGAGLDAFPLPALEAESPLGSLIYDATLSGFISPTGDTDGFTIDVDPGQTITVVVRPDDTLVPSVTLSGADGTVSDSPGMGKDAVIQLYPASLTGSTIGGNYAITVSGTGTGSYTLQVILNAAVEQEDNDDVGVSAQPIDASFIPLVDGATRGAVLGAITATLNPAASPPIEGFEDGDLSEYVINVGRDPSNAYVTEEAAHDDFYGLEDRSNDGLGGWLYRDDETVHVQQDQLISAFVRSDSGTDGSRGYFGFRATTRGTFSLVMAPNTGEFALQLNRSYNYKAYFPRVAGSLSPSFREAAF